MANVLKDAKVGFLTGAQSSIDTMLSKGANAGAKHGYFYLTKDSHRLYVGNSDGSISAVNEGVQTVTYLGDLPTLQTAADKVAYTGRFFYVQYKESTAGQVDSNIANILCVYNGSAWVQINANTDTHINSNTYTTSTTGATATITNAIGSTDGGSVTGKFEIVTAGGIKIANTAGKTNSVTLTGDKFTLTAGDGATGEVKLNLSSANGQAGSSVTLKADPNTTVLTRKENVITIAGRVNASLAIANATGGKTGFTVTVKDNQGKTVTGSYDPIIKYGSKAQSSTKLVDGVFNINAYNKEEIDQLMRDLNAMEYRGTVGANGTAATAWAELLKLPQKIGYTYLFSSPITVNNAEHTVGTLAIARGTEYTAADLAAGTITKAELVGTINPATLTWDFVESTNDTDTTYKLYTAATGVGFKLQDSFSGNKGQIKYAGAGGLTVSQSLQGGVDISQDKSAENVITITHNTVKRTDTNTNPDKIKLSSQTPTTHLNDTITIPVITGIKTNAEGHVTGVNTVNYELNDTATVITEMTSAASRNADGSIALKTKVTATSSSGKDMVQNGTATATIKSSSLTLGASGSSVSIDMTWGEF
jgi:hypothetical protein